MGLNEFVCVFSGIFRFHWVFFGSLKRVGHFLNCFSGGKLWHSENVQFRRQTSSSSVSSKLNSIAETRNRHIFRSEITIGFESPRMERPFAWQRKRWKEKIIRGKKKSNKRPAISVRPGLSSFHKKKIKTKYCQCFMAPIALRPLKSSRAHTHTHKTNSETPFRFATKSSRQNQQ